MSKISQYDEPSISLIDIGKTQARTRGIEKDLDVLINSIKKFGLLEPITLFKTNGRYELVAGQRRLLAMEKIGNKTIPAIIIKRPGDEVDAKAISFTENVVRENMVRADLVDAVTMFYRKYRTMKAVAEELAIKEELVSQLLTWPRLPKEVQDAVKKNEINLNVAIKATDALKWDSGTVEEGSKVLELALKMQPMHESARQAVKKVAQQDPSKDIMDILEKAEKREIKSITLKFEFDDYSRLENFTKKEKKESVETAVIDLLFDSLTDKGY